MPSSIQMFPVDNEAERALGAQTLFMTPHFQGENAGARLRKIDHVPASRQPRFSWNLAARASCQPSYQSWTSGSISVCAASLTPIASPLVHDILAVAADGAD